MSIPIAGFPPTIQEGLTGSLTAKQLPPRSLRVKTIPQVFKIHELASVPAHKRDMVGKDGLAAIFPVQAQVEKVACRESRTTCDKCDKTVYQEPDGSINNGMSAEASVLRGRERSLSA